MLLSVFSVCGVLVSAADAGDVLTVKATGVVDGKVTYNIYLKANVPVTGAVVFVKFDNSVLKPILPEIYVDKDGSERPALANGGAFTYTDEYGDVMVNVPGVYVGSTVKGKADTLSVAFTNINEYKSSSQKGLFSVMFDIIDDARPVTEVEFYCVEFESSDEFNIDYNKINPQLFYMVQTKTIEKTVISSVVPVANGLKVTWEPTVGASFYNFYKKKDTGGWSYVKLPATQTSYIDTDLVNGETETYAVRAFNKDGVSASTYNKITGTFVAAPAKVTAANAANGVKVSWSAVSGADSYRVFKRVVNADGTKGSWQYLVKNTTARSYTDTEVTSGVRYQYLVRTLSDGVYSANSVVGSIKYFAAPAVKISAVSGGIKLSWNEIDGAETYRIYRKYNGAKSWTAIGNVDADTLQFVDKAPKSCKKIYYTVRAFTAKDGSSNYVAKSIAYVAIPQLTSISNTRSGIQVKWTADANADGYRVYRKAAGATKWTYLKTVKTAYYNDKNVKSGTNYTYTVRTVFGKYTSGFESGISIKYLATPTLTKVSNVSAGIKFQWGDVAGETGYRVYRKTGSGSWKFIGTTKNNYYVDKNVTNGTTYRYTVRAYYGKTYSGYNTSGLSIKCS